MHEYIITNINKEIWVVMEILVQKSVRCIPWGVVASEYFDRGSAICDSLGQRGD